jgi:hypothetical protein
MRKWLEARHGIPLRDTIVVLTLFSHLLGTLGFPLPVPHAAAAKDSSHRFPCQDRPCGCLTAEECWKGDCCCFTLEQKLAWAEANGAEPPAHVRPLVEARKHLPVNSCPPPGDCCAKASSDCPACAAKDSLESSRKKLSNPEPGNRWAFGLFTQKCRGQGPAGLFQLEPAVFPDLTSGRLASPPLVATLTDRQERLTSTAPFPPTPPPRA